MTTYYVPEGSKTIYTAPRNPSYKNDPTGGFGSGTYVTSSKEQAESKSQTITTPVTTSEGNKAVNVYDPTTGAVTRTEEVTVTSKPDSGFRPKFLRHDYVESLSQEQKEQQVNPQVLTQNVYAPRREISGQESQVPNVVVAQRPSESPDDTILSRFVTKQEQAKYDIQLAGKKESEKGFTGKVKAGIVEGGRQVFQGAVLDPATLVVAVTTQPKETGKAIVKDITSGEFVVKTVEGLYTEPVRTVASFWAFGRIGKAVPKVGVKVPKEGTTLEKIRNTEIFRKEVPKQIIAELSEPNKAFQYDVGTSFEIKESYKPRKVLIQTDKTSAILKPKGVEPAVAKVTSTPKELTVVALKRSGEGFQENVVVVGEKAYGTLTKDIDTLFGKKQYVTKYVSEADKINIDTFKVTKDGGLKRVGYQEISRDVTPKIEVPKKFKTQKELSTETDIARLTRLTTEAKGEIVSVKNNALTLFEDKLKSESKVFVTGETKSTFKGSLIPSKRQFVTLETPTTQTAIGKIQVGQTTKPVLEDISIVKNVLKLGKKEKIPKNVLDVREGYSETINPSVVVTTTTQPKGGTLYLTEATKNIKPKTPSISQKIERAVKLEETKQTIKTLAGQTPEPLFNIQKTVQQVEIKAPNINLKDYSTDVLKKSGLLKIEAKQTGVPKILIFPSKTEQKEEPKQIFKPSTISKAEVINITKPDTKSEVKVETKPKTELKKSIEIRFSQLPKSKTETKQEIQQIQKQIQKQEQVQKQYQTQATTSISRVATPLRQQLPKIALPKFAVYVKPEKSKGGLFETFVRRKGKFESRGTFKTQEEATRRGLFVTGQTASASFKVLKDKQTLELGRISERYKPSTKEKGVQIQRSKFRISSAGEKAEIPGKARLYKNKISGGKLV